MLNKRTENKMKYIIAGTRRQAELFAIKNKLGSKWTYVDTPETLRGLRDIECYLTGTYNFRTDLVALRAAITERNITLITKE